MNKDEQMIDALLKEHADKGVGDDVDFLESLEKRLDEEESVSAIIEQKQSSRNGRKVMIGLGIAAVISIVAVGRFYDKHDLRKAYLSIKNNDKEGVSGEAVTSAERKNEEGSVDLTSKGNLFGVVDEVADIESGKVARRSEPLNLEKGITLSSEGINELRDSNHENLRLKAEQELLAAEKSMAELKFKIEKDVLLNLPEPSHASVAQSNMRGAGSVRPVRGLAPSLGRSRYEFRGVSPGHASRRSHKIDGKDVSPLSKKVSGPNERYGQRTDNPFQSPWKSPLSTFSVDVDTASYTNIRRMIQHSQPVPKDAVRIEEMINYFNYSYPQPEGEHPFSVNVETASCPWNTEHRLVKVGLQGKEVAKEKRPAANLVFLLDVSGSMNNQDKLPLLVDSMKVLLKELNGDDSVSIVVYAGAQGLVLPPTLVTEDGREEILEALNNMRSGGSTNGGAGITLAYKMAKKHFVKGGVNRVILGTDGDFNVGLTDRAALTSTVEREAKSGVYLSVLGFGQGNLNDAMLEDITNKGNGNYFYIDSLREGRKVFLDDMMGNIVTIAKDVKIQVEFNPAKVKSYRLIGYANCLLKAQEFKNKRIDAGEIGAGHTVTALYEIVLGNAQEENPEIDDLEYQKTRVVEKPAEREVIDSANMLTVKLAYKGPEATKETESTYFKTRVQDSEKAWKDASEDFKFASGVALFGMLKRDSLYVSEGNYSLVRQLAEEGRGDDVKGHRTEFSDLVRKVASAEHRR